jgi:hypothetical protein
VQEERIRKAKDEEERLAKKKREDEELVKKAMANASKEAAREL